MSERVMHPGYYRCLSYAGFCEGVVSGEKYWLEPLDEHDITFKIFDKNKELMPADRRPNGTPYTTDKNIMVVQFLNREFDDALDNLLKD